MLRVCPARVKVRSPAQIDLGLAAQIRVALQNHLATKMQASETVELPLLAVLDAASN